MARPFQQKRRDIDADDLTFRPDQFGELQHSLPGTASDIDDHLGLLGCESLYCGLSKG